MYICPSVAPSFESELARKATTLIGVVRQDSTSDSCAIHRCHQLRSCTNFLLKWHKMRQGHMTCMNVIFSDKPRVPTNIAMHSIGSGSVCLPSDPFCFCDSISVCCVSFFAPCPMSATLGSKTRESNIYLL